MYAYTQTNLPLTSIDFEDLRDRATGNIGILLFISTFPNVKWLDQYIIRPQQITIFIRGNYNPITSIIC